MKNVIKVLLWLAVFASPMGAQAFTIDTPVGRLSLLRIFIILSIILCIIDQLSNKKKMLVYNNSNRFSVRFMLIWFTYAIVSFLWSKDVNSWFRYIYFMFIGIAGLILFINYFKDKNSICSAFIVLNLGIVVQSIIGWYEIVTRDYKYISESNAYAYGVRALTRIPIAMSGNPNDFAMQMFIGVLLSYYCTIRAKNRFFKTLSYVVLVSDLILLVLTTSRGVILAIGISFAFILLVGGKKKYVFLVLALAVILSNRGIIDFISNALLRSSFDIRSDNTRITLMLNGLYMTIDSYGFGVGCGQCGYWLETAAKMPVSLRAMHNWWIEILASFGILIFGYYIVFYKKLAVSMYKSYISTKDEMKALYLSICSIMIGFIVGSISSSSNFTSETLWIMWGLIICLQGVSKRTN